MSKLFMTRMACRSVNLSRCTVSLTKQFSTHNNTHVVAPHAVPLPSGARPYSKEKVGTAQDILTNTTSKVVGKELCERFTGYVGKWSDLPGLLSRGWLV